MLNTFRFYGQLTNKVTIIITTTIIITIMKMFAVDIILNGTV